jgi:hypothetical protein
MSLTIKGATSGSVDVVAPASGSDVTLTLPTTTATVETTASSIASSRLTGALPALNGSALTGVGVDGIVSTANATAITIDSSENVGIGVTPSAWNTNWTALQIGGMGSISSYGTSGDTTGLILSSNAYLNTSGNWSHIGADQATMIDSTDGKWTFKTGGSSAGTAGSAITWNTAMIIANNGNVGVGITSPGIIAGGTRYLTTGTQSAGSAGFFELVGNRTANASQDVALIKFINNTTQIAEIGAYDNGSTNGGDLKFFTSSGGTTTERMKIDSAGRVTMPNQPAFYAKPTSTINNIPVQAITTIALGTEIFDLGGNFSGNAFTAPVTGKYQLNMQVRIQAVDTQSIYTWCRIYTSNRTITSIQSTDTLTSDTNYWMWNVSVLTDMDANDTAELRFYQGGGNQQQDIEQSSTNFSGYLVA